MLTWFQIGMMVESIKPQRGPVFVRPINYYQMKEYVGGLDAQEMIWAMPSLYWALEYENLLY